MKKIAVFCLALLVVTACSTLEDNPYEEVLRDLSVRLNYPENYESFVREGVRVTARDLNNRNEYSAYTDSEGVARFRMPQGLYRVGLMDRTEQGDRFNGVVEQVQLTQSAQNVTMALIHLSPSTLIIKEAYFGGCPKDPLEGRLQNDQYLIIHNNDVETQYLDGLCFGCADPYTSASSQNTWVTKDGEGNLVFQDFVPIVEALWQFPGSGRDFPLAPGEDAVLAVKGAVDFTKEFPLSVNLNKPEYFACHSRLHYANEQQHITPGDQIQDSHILRVVKKTGKANAFVIAIQSPAILIFRPTDPAFDLDAYMADDTQSLATVPGGTSQCVKIPWDWILDGVEVFYSVKNYKRLKPEIDAAPIFFTGPGLGISLHRHLDEETSAECGFEVYRDTNNSAEDFYERKTASLHQ